MEYLTKMVAIITIFTLLTGGFFVLRTEQAHSGAALLYFLKEFVIYPLVRKLANALENKLVNKINGLISGLTQKTPSFILSWRNFTLDSQARGNDIFRAVLADANLCPHLKRGLQTSFGADRYLNALSGSTVKIGGQTVFQQKTSIPGLPSFQNLTNCSMPSNFNVTEFKNDFTKGGGWAAWNKLVQPQNNFFGAYSIALDEQQKQLETELQSSRDQSIAGQGFLGQKLGISGGANPAGCVGAAGFGGLFTPPNPNAPPLNTTLNRCLFMGKEVTPASVLGITAANALDKKLGRVGGAAQITDVILNLLDAVVSGLANRILNFIGQGSYQVPPSYSPEPTPPGGGMFNPNPVDPDPSAPGNPATVCPLACRGELDSCLSGIITVCRPGEPDPITAAPGPDICGPDPAGEERCRTAYSSCLAQCSALP